MDGDDDEMVKEHKAMWQLVCLADVLLKDYAPKAGHD
jgi:hypothetical protein